MNEPSYFLLSLIKPFAKSFLFLSLPACRPDLNYSGLGTTGPGNEPFQPTLVVYMWIKCVNAKSWELPDTFQAASLNLSTSVPSPTSPMCLKKIKKSKQNLFGKVKQMQRKDVPKPNSNDICNLHIKAPLQWCRGELALPSFPL